MNSVRELLSKKDKGLSRSKDVLTYLFRHTLLWRNITYPQWRKAVDRLFAKSSYKESSDVGNINKLLVKDDLTWLGFKKGIELLSPKSNLFSIRLEGGKHGSGKDYSLPISFTESENIDTPLLVENNLLTGLMPQENRGNRNDLSRLYCAILQTENIDVAEWNRLIKEYVNHPYSGLKGGNNLTSSKVVALQRQLFDSNLTWKGLRRGIALLNADIETYRLDLEFADDKHVATAVVRKPLPKENK